MKGCLLTCVAIAVSRMASFGGYPSAPGTPPPAKSEAHWDYEVLFQASGVMVEHGAPHLQQAGTVRIIQGPTLNSVSEIDSASKVYAFIAVNHVNVPLLPDEHARRLNANSFLVRIPGYEFTISLAPQTPAEVVNEFERILAWFTCYQCPPGGYTATGGGGSGTSASARIHQAGDVGVKLVEKLADKMTHRMDGLMESQMASARNVETRNVKIGGDGTRTVLGTTRKVVGAGAGAASAITEKASDVVGSVLANNPLMKGLRGGPEGSKRFRLHNTLTAGMVAVGKVYVAADERGREMVSTTGEQSAEVLRERYGEQVADAARDGTHIAVDSYRILRFPAKFGAKALVKGAAKASLTKQANH